MEKEFVPYELAVKLKQLGFDEECFGYYDLNNKPNFFGADGLMDTHCVQVNRPTFSQAFRWFRDNHNVRQNIMDFIDDEVGIEWDYEIATIGTDLDENGNYKPLIEYSTDDENRKFKTYEESELACLTKLIELIFVL
jgi:hypothetical protein